MSAHPRSDPHGDIHFATIAHDGMIWDGYLVFDHDPAMPRSFRASIRFDRAGGEGEPASVQTTVILIEESYDEVVAKAQTFDDRSLQAMLRSALPG